MPEAKFEERKKFDGTTAKILVSDLSGTPEYDRYKWRAHIELVNMGENVDPVKKYLQTAERYFYSKDWFGSEKRKNPA